MIRQVQRLEKETDTLPVPDLAASFQAAVVEVLATKTARAAAAFGATSTILAGGVSANLALRKAVTSAVNGRVHTPPIPLCTDNAAMVAACGYWRFQAGQRDGWDMDVAPGLPLA